MTVSRGLIGLSLVCLVIAPSPTYAQEAGEDAHRVFMRAAAAYGSGDYEEAARLFEEAYAQNPETALLLNLGLARERAGMAGPAIEAYEQFLAEAPDADERPDVERSLVTLRRQRALEEEVARRAQPEEPAPARSAPEPAPWAIFGVGVAGLVAAAVLGAVAVSRYDGATWAVSHRDALALEQEANDFGLGANILFGVGGALALAGVIWGTFDLVRVAGATP